ANRGLTETLRVSLADLPNVHVCSLYPYSVNTPHMVSAENEFRRRPRLMPPVQAPEKVAAEIVALAKRPRHERHVPSYLWLATVLKSVMGRTGDRVLLHALQRFHLGAPFSR